MSRTRMHRVKRRPERFSCACHKDSRAQRPAGYKPTFSAEVLLALTRGDDRGMMSKLGYDIDQHQLGAGEYGLREYTLPQSMLTNHV